MIKNGNSGLSWIVRQMSKDAEEVRENYEKNKELKRLSKLHDKSIAKVDK